ncbi:uncharacterized protein LOC106866882 [Brachypodium distachyon]|uniref:uncharacterized protein LOC106866882 n=1 Tax=Brachypodium distachyon TaxID=15368 RepID=UPI00071DBE44|nr:uncharacterized protein LOC106866882 [Brachypodium distachyon]|eukprot:XP_014758739.1 uncharacterized protein LOC106866882 [Brachypodium distachyon]
MPINERNLEAAPELEGYEDKKMKVAEKSDKSEQGQKQTPKTKKVRRKLESGRRSNGDAGTVLGEKRREEGGWAVKEEEEKEVVIDYFNNLFRSINNGDANVILDAVEPRVTGEMNNFLSTPYTENDVREAMFSIGHLKASGPDGMCAIFYKNYWDIVGDRVTSEVLNVMNGGKIPDGWNDTIIALIPKVKKPNNIKDLRPISLCNVIYKIIAKLVAKRLKLILPDIISESQIIRVKVYGDLTSEIVPGRGLQQGDPISPYLFLLCAEGLSALLFKAERDGLIQGVKICIAAPRISHLFFADDSLILCRAKEGDARALKVALQVYECFSSQVINKNKSAIMFSPNTNATEKGIVMSTLSSQHETTNDRYLGMPVHVGKSKTRAFNF